MVRCTACPVALLLLSVGTASAETWTGEVVRVTDGDMLRVLRDRKAVKIRLHGADCPEKGQPYSKQAERFVKSLVSDKTVSVTVVSDEAEGLVVAEIVVRHTHYVEVFRGDQVETRQMTAVKNLGEELVRSGLAWWNREDAPNSPELQRLQRAAQKAKRGLWADKAPIAPWDWRTGKQTCEADDDCHLRQCCCEWLPLRHGGPLPSACRRRCRCSVPPRPDAARCVAGTCSVVSGGSD